MVNEPALYRRLRDAKAAHRAERLARAEVHSTRAAVLAAEVALREAGER